MNTKRLIMAAIIISDLMGKEVTAIQFEDGSANKFNYQLNCSEWKFIDLTRYFAPANEMM